MLDMRNREADREEERQERRMRQEEQREDCRLQQQMQEQLMTVMLCMMSGRSMPPAPAIPSMQAGVIPPMHVTETYAADNGSDGQNSDSNKD